MDDLATWLRAQLDEDELAASAASASPWTAWRSPGLGLRNLEHAVALPGDGPGSLASIATASWVDAEHIARWDSARVLAEVEAKRKMLDWLDSLDRYMDRDDMSWHRLAGAVDVDDARRLLAQPFAGRDGWREEWRLDGG